MTYNEAETRFYLIDPILRDKGYDDYQRLKLEGGSVEQDIAPFALFLGSLVSERLKGKQLLLSP